MQRSRPPAWRSTLHHEVAAVSSCRLSWEQPVRRPPAEPPMCSNNSALSAPEGDNGRERHRRGVVAGMPVMLGSAACRGGSCASGHAIRGITGVMPPPGGSASSQGAGRHRRRAVGHQQEEARATPPTDEDMGLGRSTTATPADRVPASSLFRPVPNASTSIAAASPDHAASAEASGIARRRRRTRTGCRRLRRSSSRSGPGRFLGMNGAVTAHYASESSRDEALVRFRPWVRP